MNVIDKAIERLQGNWLKGSMGDGKNVCALGALIDVGARAGHQRVVYQVLSEETGRVAASLTAFNDDPSTTEEDVLLLMKKASARLDEMEAGA